MKVRMKTQISGSRGNPNETWPAPGEVTEVPDEEGMWLCERKLAEPVAEIQKEEKRPAQASAELRQTAREALVPQAKTTGETK